MNIFTKYKKKYQLTLLYLHNKITVTQLEIETKRMFYLLRYFVRKKINVETCSKYSK